MNNISILIVEDETIVAANISKILEMSGYIILDSAVSGEEAIDKVHQLQPDVILMDINLIGDMDGIEASSLIRQDYDIPIVFLTGYSDQKTVARVKKETPYGYVLKPFRKRELEVVIEMAVYKHNMEVQLKEKEERYQRLVKNAPLGVMSINIQGFIKEINPMFAKILGTTIDENVYSINVFQYKPLIACGYVDDIKRCIEESIVLTPDYEFTNFEGRFFVLHSHLSPIVNEKDQLIGALIIAEDITDTAEIEKELSNNEEWLAMALHSSGMGFFDWDMKTDYTIYDYNWVNILEYQYEDVLGDISFWKDNIHPDDLQSVEDLLEQHIMGKTEAFKCSHRIKAKSGDWKHVIIHSAVIQRDKSGKALRMIGTIRDQTEYIKTESDLKKLQSKFDALVNAMPLPALVWEQVGNEFFLVEYNQIIIEQTIGEISNYKGIESGKFYEKNKGIAENLKKCRNTKENLNEITEYHDFFTDEKVKAKIFYIFIPDQYVMVCVETEQ